MSSTFIGTPFDWKQNNPKREIADGILVLSGDAIVYYEPDVEILFTFYRPVSRRVAGNPMVGGTVYIDYWGPDPSGLLITSPWVEVPGGTPPTHYGNQYTAILSGFSRQEVVPGPLHFCQMEFTILAGPTTIVVPARGAYPELVSGV